MDPIFPPKINQLSLKPSRLEYHRVKLEHNLQKRKLLTNKEASISDQNMLQLLQKLFVSILKNKNTLKQKHHVQVMQYIALKQRLYPSIFEYPAAMYFQALNNGMLTLSLKNSWILLCEFYQNETLKKLFAHNLKNTRSKRNLKRKRQFEKLLTGITLDTDDLCTALSNKVIKNSVALHQIDDFLNLPDSILRNAIYDRLTSQAGLEYLYDHKMEDLIAFLNDKKEANPHLVSQCIRTMLEYWHDHHFRPEMLQKGTQTERLIAALRSVLPIDEDSQHWTSLGRKVQYIFKRWKILHEIDEYFNKWDATETRRKSFWKGYLNDISDVQPFPAAEALGMLIGNHWYIEFGRKGNACYRYLIADWNRHRFRERQKNGLIRNSEALKDLPKDKKNHSSSWESAFHYWIGKGVTWN